MGSCTTASLNHTMPQRLTVARVAYRSVSTSNIMRTFGGSASLSPLGSILDPFRINVAVKNNPVPFRTLASHVVHDLSQDVGKQPVRPFPGGGVQSAVEGVLRHRLRVDH
ncbi:MAG: hypothetical protein BJ554DRAFT_2250, partial [Olpidium bornovanus]